LCRVKRSEKKTASFSVGQFFFPHTFYQKKYAPVDQNKICVHCHNALSCTMVEHVAKFNTVMCMFLSDLAASVPEVSAITEARDWMQALQSINPGSDKVLRIYMDSMKGMKDVISTCNPSIFKNLSLLPSIISQEDMWNVFRALGEQDRKECWRYLSKLFRAGKAALMEWGEYDEQSECDMSISGGADGSSSSALTLQNIIGAGPQGLGDLQNIEMPSGPIVTVAFQSLCSDLVKNLEAALPGNNQVLKAQTSISELTAGAEGALLEHYQLTFSPEASQGLVTDTEATLRAYGLPFFEGGAPAAAAILDDLSEEQRAATVGTCMQLGTLAMTLQSVDAKTIGAVEDVARNFVAMLQRGEIDLATLSNDPFSMLQTLADSGIADSLMELIGQQEA
jgi:hypothetical protein